MAVKVSSRHLTAHTRGNQDNILVQEVDSLTIWTKVDAWVAAVAGVSVTQLNQWVSVIKTKEFFSDPAVTKALAAFCGARAENARYVPLASLLNRILELAKVHHKDMEGKALLCFELKFERKLLDKLNVRRKKKNLPTPQEEDFPPVRR